MHQLTSGYQGVTTPVNDLYGEIARQGWSLLKVEPPKKDGLFKATAQSPHGEKQEAQGRAEVDAVANLLMRIMRVNYMRAAAVRLATWKTDWKDQLGEIAEAYSQAPVYDAKAASAWMELAHDSARRAQILSAQITIEVVDNPEPYKTAQDMIEDVQRKQHLYVSRADTRHPIWTQDQFVAFRVVHDVLGHVVAGADFTWTGENQATAAHMPLLSPNAQKALFTQTIGRTAFGAYYRSAAPTKIAFLDDFIEPVQQKENGAGHWGVHPSQSVVPAAGPAIKPKEASAPGVDPNAGWTSGIEPLPTNAFQWQGDPLDAHKDGGLMDTAGKVDTGWHSYAYADGSPDTSTAKQAVTNALRMALLSDRKGLQGHAVHYQDLLGLPADVDDPKRFNDALERSREVWNQSIGMGPGAHKPYWKAERDFTGYVRSQYPDLSDVEARELAEREWQHIWHDEEERLTLDPKNANLSADEIEKKVAKDVERRVLTLLKPNENEKTDVPDQRFASDKAPYPAWLRGSARDMANVGFNAGELTDAALHDVKHQGGTGHHFRSTAVNLGLSPKVASHAWMFLQPNTSQLGVIDRHAMEMLGRDHDKEMNDRDYYKYERELAAGRDAAGYGHVPLSAFQWGMWDHKRGGPGTHQDHSALRPLDPVHHELIDWPEKEQLQPTEDWRTAAPLWWQETEPARQLVGDEWDQTVAPNYSKDTIPERTASGPTFTRTPYFLHPDTGDVVEGQPGQSLMHHMRNSLGLSTQEVWALDHDAGKR